MLILTRNVGESIVIDGDIEVFVSSVRGNQVSLGIKAPSDITVNRSEIQDIIDYELDKEYDEDE